MGNAKRDAYLDILADEFEKMGMMDEDGWDTLEKPVPNAKTVKPEPAVGQEKPELPTAKPKKPEPPTVKPKKPEPPTAEPENPEPLTAEPEEPEVPTAEPEKPEPPTAEPEKPEPPTAEPEKPKPTEEIDEAHEEAGDHFLSGICCRSRASDRATIEGATYAT